MFAPLASTPLAALAEEAESEVIVPLTTFELVSGAMTTPTDLPGTVFELTKVSPTVRTQKSVNVSSVEFNLIPVVPIIDHAVVVPLKTFGLSIKSVAATITKIVDVPATTFNLIRAIPHASADLSIVIPLTQIELDVPQLEAAVTGYNNNDPRVSNTFYTDNDPAAVLGDT